MIGRHLGRLFVGLLMSTKIGVHAEWKSTLDNLIADDQSRLKKANEKGEFDYTQLKRTCPMLAPCRQFQPSNILRDIIWDFLLRNLVPDPLMVKQLKPCALGHFIS